jgi:hypothetical protein
MPRQTLARTAGPNKSPASGASTAVTMTAEDATNHSQFQWTGREALLIFNSGASTHTFTLQGVTDPYNRAAPAVAQNVLAGAIHILLPLSAEAWRQSDGYIYIDGNHAELKFGVVDMP